MGGRLDATNSAGPRRGRHHQRAARPREVPRPHAGRHRRREGRHHQARRPGGHRRRRARAAPIADRCAALAVPLRLAGGNQPPIARGCASPAGRASSSTPARPPAGWTGCASSLLGGHQARTRRWRWRCWTRCARTGRVADDPCSASTRPAIRRGLAAARGPAGWSFSRRRATGRSSSTGRTTRPGHGRWPARWSELRVRDDADGVRRDAGKRVTAMLRALGARRAATGLHRHRGTQRARAERPAGCLAPRRPGQPAETAADPGAALARAAELRRDPRQPVSWRVPLPGGRGAWPAARRRGRRMTELRWGERT